MSFTSLVENRFSVRDYREEPVARETILKVLQAARLAPSACNLQPWHFVVVTQRERREQMRAVYDRDWFVHAPAHVMVCIDTGACWKRGYDGKSYGDVDAAIAMDHIILAATEAGLGTCWIAAFDPVAARKVLELPGHIEPVVLTPLGVPAATPPQKKRKGLDSMVRWERFGR